MITNEINTCSLYREIEYKHTHKHKISVLFGFKVWCLTNDYYHHDHQSSLSSVFLITTTTTSSSAVSAASVCMRDPVQRRA